MPVTLGEVIAYHNEKKAGTAWKSPNSIKNNVATLRIFMERVKEITGIDPDIEDVDDVLVYHAIERQWPNTGTTNTYRVNFARIKSFFNWSIKRGYRFGDLENFLAETPSAPDVEKVFTTQEDIDKAVAYLTSIGDHRRASILEFQFETHRRGGELVTMQVKDVDLKPKADAPHGVYWFKEHKESKVRHRMELLERDAEILSLWLEEYRKLMGVEKLDGEWYLWPAAHAVGGTPGRKEIVPERGIANHTYLFRSIWQEVDLYKRGKAGHANRRGGMTTMYDAMYDAGISDPILHIMERSLHKSRVTAEGYIDRNGRRKRSNAIYAQIKKGRNTPPTQEAPEPAVTTQEGGKVIEFASLRNRRTAG